MALGIRKRNDLDQICCVVSRAIRAVIEPRQAAYLTDALISVSQFVSLGLATPSADVQPRVILRERNHLGGRCRPVQSNAPSSNNLKSSGGEYAARFISKGHPKSVAKDKTKTSHSGVNHR